MSALIAALDSALRSNSEKIKLRLTIGVSNKVNVDVDCVAAVRSPTSQELVGDVTQDDLFCILSPTQINAAQWPGGQPQGVTDDLRIPKQGAGYSAFVRGRWRAVLWGQGFYPDGLVRIEIRVQG